MSMKCQCRIFDPETDYPMVAGWWKGHGWDAVPQTILPKLGMVMLAGDVPVVAGWLYMDNSVGVAILEWIVANPAAKPTEVFCGIRDLVEVLTAEARAFDYGVILTTCKQEGLAKLLQRAGFMETDRNMIHLVKVVPLEA